MTDEELLAKANRFILDHETDETALASVALWNLLQQVRDATARECAELCSGLNDAMENQGYMYETCARVIRARFKLTPEAPGSKGAPRDD